VPSFHLLIEGDLFLTSRFDPLETAEVLGKTQLRATDSLNKFRNERNLKFEKPRIESDEPELQKFPIIITPSIED